MGPKRFARCLVLVLAAGCATTSSPSPRAGIVAPVGGGGEAPGLVPKLIALAGGVDAPVVVIPAASSVKDAGRSSVEMWKHHGSERVTLWNPKSRSDADQPESLEVLREARIYWFGGGSQERIMQLLAGTEALRILRRNHAQGAIVGGTSAGAAVLGDVMLVRGDPEGPIAPDRLPTAAGLGVLPDFIVDQHLLARARVSRLLNILPAHPSLKGLGLEERTAAIIGADSIEIVGAGQAVLYSTAPGSVADMPPTTTRPLWRIPEIRLSVLLPGDRVPR